MTSVITGLMATVDNCNYAPQFALQMNKMKVNISDGLVTSKTPSFRYRSWWRT